jgi:DNA-binding NarL/FixJ family response regulator
MMLIDLGTDSNDGLAIVTSMKTEFPAVKIVGMGLNPLQPDIRDYVQAGVDGFILQDATLDEMLATLRTVGGGEMVLPTAMTGSLFSQVAGHAIVKETKTNTSDNGMTQREKEVIALITEGMSNKQIGNTLNIATFTVKSHVHNILEKLAVSSRLQIATHTRN